MEEIIELESSDEEQGPPPGKKRKPCNQPIATNIMVNIPHGVTIKPVGKRKIKSVQKISNVTTINKAKPQSQPLPKRLPNINVVKKTTLFSQNTTQSQVLKKLPPSVTVTKTGPSIATPKRTVVNVTAPQIVQMPKVPQIVRNKETTPTKKRQWYKPPEESVTSPDIIPSKKAFIEIVIDDSPVKPKAKQVRQLSNENVITIDDSPNKALPINTDNDEGSDDEPSESKKAPNSKKKLEYKDTDLPTIVEERTYEIEIDPIAVDEPISIPDAECDAPELISNSEKEQKSSLETTLEKAAVLPEVIDKPTQSKKEKEVGKNLEDQEFHPVYMQFIELCLKLENSDDMLKIVDKKIKPYYKQVSKDYTHSEEFIERVASKIASIKANPKEMYLYIKDIVDDLNIQRKLAKQEMSVQEDKAKETFTQINEDLAPNKKKQINKLEKSLKKFNRAIKKLEMQEVDFDDEDGSVYLLTEKYKERIVRIHAKLCQLTNTKMPSEPRLVLDPGPGRAPGPARRLENWINKKKGVAFPDFHDVLRCVREANTEDNLGWNEATVMEEARDLFCRCGKKLQRRRQEREWRSATSRLSVDADPAEESEELKRKLDDNRRVARTNESEVLNKWSTIQNHQNLEPEEIDDKDADESPIDSEEDDDENSTLENKQKRKDILKKLLKEQAKKTSIQPNTEETAENVVENAESNKSPKVDDEIMMNDDDENKDEHNSDSDEMGSDVDELHLLQKLRSDDVVFGISSSESSDESPIAISDSAESSSDESVISIVLSSDDEVSQDSKTDKKTIDVTEDNVGSNSASLDLENERSRIALTEEVNLSPDTVVALDSKSDKSEEPNILSSKTMHRIAEETSSKTSQELDNILDDEVILLPDAVVSLETEPEKSVEVNKLLRESNVNINKNTMNVTVIDQDNFLDEELMLPSDTVISLDYDNTKIMTPEVKDTIGAQTISGTPKERDNNLDDKLVFSLDASLDSKSEKFEGTQKVSKDKNSIAEKIVSKTIEERNLTINDEEIPNTVAHLIAETDKSKEVTNSLGKSKSNIVEENTVTKTSNEENIPFDNESISASEAMACLNTETEKSEQANKLSRESKNTINENTTCKIVVDHDSLDGELILPSNAVATLDCEYAKSEKTQKILADNSIAENNEERNATSTDELMLSADTVVALNSETEKSEQANKLSRESKNTINENTTCKIVVDHDSLDGELILPSNAVATLDCESAKSEKTQKILADNSIAENNEERNATSTDELMLSADTVVALNSETDKSKASKNSPEKDKDKVVDENTVTQASNEWHVPLNEEIILSSDAMEVSNCEFESVETKNSSVETKDNVADENTATNSSIEWDVPLNDELILSPDIEAALDSETRKSEETIKITGVIKVDITEKTSSGTVIDQDNFLEEELILPSEMVTLASETEKLEEAIMLSIESKDNIISENTMNKISDHHDKPLEDELILSPDIVVNLVSEIEKSDEPNKSFQENNIICENGKNCEEMGSSDSVLNATEINTQKYCKADTGTNGEENKPETLTLDQQEETKSTNVKEASNDIPCVSTHAIESNNSDASVPDLIQSCTVDDENDVSNDLRAAGSPMSVQAV